MDIILSRRSIRKYTQEPVADEDVKDLLKAAMAAPSACNQQPWEFIVINQREILDKIPEIHPYSRMITEAPVAILVCGDLNKEVTKAKGFWVQDCSAATENILLAAQDRGLGAVWLGVYPNERYRQFQEMFGLPEHVIPFSLIPVGHPAEHKPPADRFEESRVHYNKW